MARKQRIVHWRWGYRLRYRPHVLLVAPDESAQTLRLSLQSRWMLSVAYDLTTALTLSQLLLPSRIVIDAAVPKSFLMIERLKRDFFTHPIPMLCLAHTAEQRECAKGCGAQISRLTRDPVSHEDVVNIQLALMDLGPSGLDAVGDDHGQVVDGNCPSMDSDQSS